MGKRTLIILISALVFVFAGVGAAAAARESGSPDENGTTADVLSDLTVSTTEGIRSPVGDEQSLIIIEPREPDADQGGESGDEVGDVSPDKGNEFRGSYGSAAPGNFGQTISALRASGDHTPAAVIKGKKVPGYYKKIAAGTTTTTAVATESD